MMQWENVNTHTQAAGAGRTCICLLRVHATPNSRLSLHTQEHASFSTLTAEQHSSCMQGWARVRVCSAGTNPAAYCTIRHKPAARSLAVGQVIALVQRRATAYIQQLEW